MADFGATEIAQLTSGLSESQKAAFQSQYDAAKKDPQMIMIIAICAGSLGVDRFMLDDAKMGIVKLLTGGGCGILWLMDIFSAKERTAAFNRKKAEAIIASL